MKYVAWIVLLAEIATGQVVTAKPGHKLMIFGGTDHKVYLGCLSCSEFASDSVLNKFGTHGSSFETDSIFNQFGRYGGKFENTSPCNEFGASPPVIVDNHGGFYGELTLNDTRTEQVRNDTVMAWLKTVCGADDEKKR
jgi:hypothetical protein